MEKKFSVSEIKRYLNTHDDITIAYEDITESTVIEANLPYIYQKDANWESNHMTTAEFMNWVRDKNIQHEQITAYPAIKMNKDVRYNKNVEIYLYRSKSLFLRNIPDTATHVDWESK